MKKHPFRTPVLLILAMLSIMVSIIGIGRWKPVRVAAQSQTDYALIYAIDYSNVPPLTYQELTWQIDVGPITDAVVVVDNEPVSHTYDSATGILQFTTDGSSIEIGLTDVANVSAIGSLQPATLKEDKKWAWSIGFDDNVLLKTTLSMMESYGYLGTIFQIAKDIDDTRVESWIIDKPDMITYLNNGWSLGNHTWTHECGQAGDRTATIVDGYNRITQIVGESNRPDYKVISFAAPCFDANYHPYILNMRDSGTTAVQFNESGSNFPMVVDPGQTTDFTLDGRTVYAFDVDDPIARDFRIEYDVPNAIAELDWIASQASASRHFWHNSLSHGSNLSEVQQVVAHLDSNYGTNGTDEVWIAPSDHIYSYLLVRDNVTAALVDSYVGSPPSAQLPGPVTQIGPQGNVSSGSVPFTWQVQAVATEYELVVYRFDTDTIVFHATYPSSDICTEISCTVTPTAAELSMAPGNYTSLVRGGNWVGYGPWLDE